MKKRIIAIIMIILLIPLKVSALTGSTSLECDKSTVIKGDTINCTLKGTIAEDSFAGYHGIINVETDYYEILSVTPSSVMEQYEANNPEMLYASFQGATGEFDIATFAVKVKETISDAISAQTSISIIEQQMLGMEDLGGKTITPTVHNVKINSTNNKLSGITLSPGTISPEFNADTTTYTATVDAATVTVSATAASTASQIEGTGEKALEYGTNTVQITVTPEQGTPKTYTLSITREDNRNSGCNINNIEFYNYDINFNKSNTNYTINVKDTIDNVKVGDSTLCPNDSSICIKKESIQLDNNAIISEISLNGEKLTTIPTTGHGYTIGSLNQGENILNITVKAENNDTKIYKFTINRGQKENNDSSSNTPSSSSSTTGGKGDVTNPKTGSSFIYSIILILIASLAIVYYYYRKSDKERKKDVKE